MSCDDVAAAIVDTGLPRPAEFQAHLDGCPRCQELARLHEGATALRLPVPPPLAPLPRQAVLGEVRRRHHRRRALAGASMAGAVAALVLIVTPRGGPAPAPPPSPLVEVDTAALGLLIDEVHSYTRHDPTVEDEIYSAFGALALWVRPPEVVALSDGPFRTALEPLHPSPTQEPLR